MSAAFVSAADTLNLLAARGEVAAVTAECFKQLDVATRGAASMRAVLAADGSQIIALTMAMHHTNVHIALSGAELLVRIALSGADGVDATSNAIVGVLHEHVAAAAELGCRALIAAAAAPALNFVSAL